MFFLQCTDWEKTFYKAHANKLTRVKNLSKKFIRNNQFSKESKTLMNFGNLLIQSFPRNAQTHPLLHLKLS